MKFGIEHYDIDIDWVRYELNEDRDLHSAALMDFDRMIGIYKEPDDYDYNSFDESFDKIAINNARIDTIIQKYAPGLIKLYRISNFL